MKSRHRAREIALQMLYQYDTAPSAGSKVTLQNRELAHDLSQHFEHFNVPQELREFVGQLVIGTLDKIPALDELLEKHTSNWKVMRMSSVDRSLLRMATYEMTFLSEVSPLIVIDEAIELAKQFGTEDSPSFINGVLDSIRNRSSEPA